MDRLTIKELIEHCDRQMNRIPGGNKCYQEHESVRAYLQILRHYIDTELTPKAAAQLKQIAEIFNCDPNDHAQLKQLCDKLRGWKQAEQAGRLVVLPCKVGDTVYFPVESRWDSATIEHIEVWSSGVRFFWVQYDVGPETNELWADGDFEMKDIGKTVFLTRQEAKTAVERGKGVSDDA